MVAPIASFAQAVAAYNRAASVDGAPAEAVASERQESFAHMLTSALDGVVGSSRSAEQTTMAALVDQANLNEVVTAVSEAETALQTVAAIRDRIIESYKEIMRMPI
jgi:flagellar hook-basal body complex protein FliE